MRRLITASAIAFLSIVAFGTARADEVRSLRLATGNELGTYNLVGSAIHIVLEQSGAAGRVRVEALPTGGSTINLTGLREGAFDLAVVQADQAIDAFKGLGVFAGKSFPELRAIARLHDETLAVLTRSDAGVAGLSDLAGKRLAAGVSDSPTRVLVERLLTTADVKANFVGEPLSPEAVLCRKKADAYLTVTGHPSALLAGVIARCRAKVDPVEGPAVDKMTTEIKGLEKDVVPRRVYVGVGKAVPTLGTRAILVARADLDDAVVTDVVRAIAENLDLMRMLHPALWGLNDAAALKPTLDEPTVHPAAARYFEGLPREKKSAAREAKTAGGVGK